MKAKHAGLALLLQSVVLTAAAAAVTVQNCSPTNWVNDPFTTNENFTLTGGNTPDPVFTNTGSQRGTLYFHSPLLTSYSVKETGEKVTLTGAVSLQGDINPDADMQFRFGLFQKGGNQGDTNWLGYFVGTPTGRGGSDQTGLYIRNNYNGSIYTSGFSPHAFRPFLEVETYRPGFSPGNYHFMFSIERISPDAQEITWKIAQDNTNQYYYAGSYTNTVANTFPTFIDHVGGMGGAGLFNSARPENVIRMKNVLVQYTSRNPPSKTNSSELITPASK